MDDSKTSNENVQMPGQRGNIYQVKLLMLYMHRGLKKYKKFELGTEIKEAYKFDDLVFKYQKVVDGTEKNHFILLQAKHSTEINAKIKFTDLFTNKDDKFKLEKYFNAYIEAKSEKLFEDGVIEHAIVYATADFNLFGNIPQNNDDWKKLKNIKNITEDIKVDKDSALSLCKTEGGKFYRFKSDLVLPVLKPLLSVYPMIAQKLFDALDENNTYEISPTDWAFKKYGNLLAEDVIDVDKKKLREEFINETRNDNGRGKLRRALNEVAKERGVNLDKIIRKTLKMRKRFGKTGKEKNWPEDVVDADIREFFGKLVFVTGQPDEIKLGDIIKKELGNDYAPFNVDLIFSHFLTEIQSWMTGQNFGIDKSKDGSKKRFISPKTAREFFVSTKGKLNETILKGPIIEYDEYIDKYNIGFVDSKLEETMKHFIDSSEKKVFNVISEHIVISFIKVYQELKKNKNQREFIYTRISSLNKDSANLVMEAFESLSDVHWLVIESDLDKTKLNHSMEKIIDEICSDVIDTIQNNNEKKVILISNDDDILKSNLQSVFSSDDEFEVLHDVKNTLANFTKDSQNNLLKTEINFQGCKVALGDLIITEELKTIFDGDMILKILKKEDIEIGKRVEGLKDEKKYYIERKFIRKIENKDNIYLISGIDEKDLCSEDLNFEVIEGYESLTNNESEIFKCVVEENSSSNIYLLRKLCDKFIILEKSGKKQLEKSNFQKAIKCENSCELKLISAIAGMGKSTLFTNLSKKIKKENPTSWVIKINLNDVSSKFNEIKASNQNIEFKQVIDFLHFGANHVTQLEKNIFDYYLLRKNIILFFDGFDEICPYYNNIFLKIIEELKRKTKIKEIWLSTRPYDLILKDVKGSFTANTLKHYDIQPFTEVNQIDYLENFWVQSIEINKQSFQIFTAELFDLLSKDINDRRFEFLGVALHMVMVSVTFKKIFEDFQNSELNISELRQELKKMLQLSKLYENFVKHKFKIYWINKNDGNLDRAVSINLADDKYASYLKRVKTLALDSLLNENDLKIFLTNKKIHNLMERKIEMKDRGDELGIVNRIIDNKPHFIHRTFSEYFTAVFLLDSMTKDDEKSLNIHKHFLNKMIVDQNYSVICKFINSELNIENFELFNKCNNEIKRLEGYKFQSVIRENWQNIAMWLIENGIDLNQKYIGGNVLHVIFPVQNSKLTSIVIEKLKPEQQQLINLLEEKNYNGNTPLNLALENGRIENIKFILNTYAELELTDHTFIDKFNDRRNVIHRTVSDECDYDTFDYVLNYLKSDTVRLKSYLLKKNEEYMTPIDTAVEYGQLNKVKVMLDTITDLGIFDEVFLNKDVEDGNVFHYASDKDCKENVLIYLLNFMKNESAKMKAMLLVKDKNLCTPFDYMVREGRLTKVKPMLNTIIELGILDEVFSNEDANGRNIFHYAANDNCEDNVLIHLLDLMKSESTKMGAMLLVKDKELFTSWNRTVLDGRLTKVKAMLEVITDLGIFDKVFSNEDVEGRNIFHHAADVYCDDTVLIHLLNSTKNEPTKMKAMLLVKDKELCTPLDHMVKFGQLTKVKAILDTIIELGILDEVFLNKDVNGKNVFHHAADVFCKDNVLIHLLNLMENETTKMKEMLLVKDNELCTPFDLMVKFGRVKKVKAMLDTITELGILDEVYSNKDVNGKNVFHHAAHKNCDENIIIYLLNFMKIEMKTMLLVKDKYLCTPFDYVVKYGRLKKVKAMLNTIIEMGILNEVFFNENGKPRYLFYHVANKECEDNVLIHLLNLMKNESMKMVAMLRVKDIHLCTPLHRMVKFGRLTKVKAILDTITKLGILDEIFSKEDVDGKNLFHYAADKDCEDNVLIHLLDLMKNELTKMKAMLIVKDKELCTPLDHMVKFGPLTKVKVLLDTIIELGILDEVFSHQDLDGRNVFHHTADKDCEVHILIYLLNMMKNESTKMGAMLLVKDKELCTSLDRMVKFGQLTKVKAMLDTITELGILDEVFSNEDVDGKNIFHHAADENCDDSVLIHLLNLMKNKTTKMKAMLLVKDKELCTALHLMVKFGQLKKVKAMLDTVTELGILDEVFSNEDIDDRNIFHHAAGENCDDNVLIHLLNLMKNEPTKMKAMLLFKDKESCTPLDRVVKFGRSIKVIAMLDTITELRILNEMFSNVDVDGRNVFHHAADEDCEDNVLIHLWDFMKGEPEKIQRMLLVKDNNLCTPLDVAEKSGNFTRIKVLSDTISELGILEMNQRK